MTPPRWHWTRAFGLFTLVVVMVVTFALPAKQAEAAPVRIRSVAFGTCLTAVTITALHLQACNNLNTQSWQIAPVINANTIRSVAWGTCVWVFNGNIGTSAQLSPCGAAGNDKWVFVRLASGAVIIRSVLGASHCLTALPPPSTTLVLNNCVGGPDQQFVFF